MTKKSKRKCLSLFSLFCACLIGWTAVWGASAYIDKQTMAAEAAEQKAKDQAEQEKQDEQSKLDRENEYYSL